MSEMNVYIYGLIDPRNDELRYIGKTNDPEKRLRDHIKEAKMTRQNNHNYNWIRSLLNKGIFPYMEIFEEIAEDSWREIEQAWISAAKSIGLNLTNQTDGGEGVSSFTNQGRIFTEKHRRNLSKSAKGKKFTKEHRKNLSKAHKGKDYLINNKHALGYNHTEETKRKISEASKRMWEKRRKIA